MRDTEMVAPLAERRGDGLAPVYDRLWSDSAAGRAQRDAFWRYSDPYFVPGQTVLDLGCGTGADSENLINRGVKPLAIDSSPQMVAVAQGRGVNARVLAIEAGKTIVIDQTEVIDLANRYGMTIVARPASVLT